MKSEMEKLREKQRRRRQKRTLRILLISPLIALAFVVTLSLMTRIRTVTVRNPTRYSSVEIVGQFGFSVGDSLFSVNREQIADRIVSACPYVKAATVSYSFPDGVEVTLTSAVPVYALHVEDAVLLADADFKILEAVESVPEGVLSVYGIDLSSYTVGQVLDEEENLQVGIVRELSAALKEHALYGNAKKIDLSKKYNIGVLLFDAVSVELGNSDELSEKVDTLVSILADNDPSVPAKIRVTTPSEGRYQRLPVTDTDRTPSASTDGDTDSGTADDSSENDGES